MHLPSGSILPGMIMRRPRSPTGKSSAPSSSAGTSTRFVVSKHPPVRRTINKIAILVVGYALRTPERLTPARTGRLHVSQSAKIFIKILLPIREKLAQLRIRQLFWAGSRLGFRPLELRFEAWTVCRLVARRLCRGWDSARHDAAAPEFGAGRLGCGNRRPHAEPRVAAHGRNRQPPPRARPRW
jgi:hypothetical protein